MVQLISMNEQAGTAQIVVKEKGEKSVTLHLWKKRGTLGIFKTKPVKNEANEIVVPSVEFDLSGLQPTRNNPSRPSNPEKGHGKGAGGKKKSREQKEAEKDAAKKPNKGNRKR